MTDRPVVVIHFREIENNDQIRDSIEKQSRQLAEDFGEINRIEISLEANTPSFAAHGHVTGKGIDIATQAEASELAPAIHLVFDKIQRQLRKLHDKRIFTQRRGAQRDPAKRKNAEEAGSK